MTMMLPSQTRHNRKNEVTNKDVWYATTCGSRSWLRETMGPTYTLR